MYDVLTWLTADPLGRDKLALLVLCTLVIYVIVTRLTWRLTAGAKSRRIAVRVADSWLGRFAAQFLRLLFFVGIPMAVLWRGALVAEMGIPITNVVEWGDGRAVLQILGLSQTQEVGRLGAGLAVGTMALCVLVAVWAWYACTASTVSVRSIAPFQRADLWWIALREALFLQILLAFYRAVVAMWTTDRLYIGFLSLALVAIAWILNPQRHRLLGDSSRSHAIVLDWLVVLLTAFASLTIRSVWALVLLHAICVWASFRLLIHLAHSRESVVRVRG
jgi:hypothetical protein